MEPTTPSRTLTFDQLRVEVHPDDAAVGRAAAAAAAATIAAAVAQRGEANLIVSTGNSMRSFFAALRATDGVPWPRIRLFLVDQYLGVDPEAYGTLAFLRKHLLAYVTPKEVVPAPVEVDDVEARCAAYEERLRRHPADLATIGFGENGHVAFNDPHNAAFDDPRWVRPVELAPESRQQPVNEGRFPSLDVVPTHAVTITIPPLIAAPTVLCIVPERRKAEAVRRCMLEPIDPSRPGSILRRVPQATLFLDEDSASLLPSGAG